MALDTLRHWIGAGLIGRSPLVERLLIALLTGGHVLIEGAPGLATTRAATQNPIEQDGTFPLPEAQLDRFQMHVVVGYPDQAEERAILDLVEGEAAHEPAPMAHQLHADAILVGAGDVAQVHLSPALKDYIMRLVLATRDAMVPEVRKAIEHPVLPRGTLALAAAVRARAWMHGRDHGLPSDVAELAPDVLAHRLVPTWRARAEGVTARSLVSRLIEAIPAL